MPRNMSFMLTTEQVKLRKKTVTRRLGWDFLKQGDVLNACEQCQGLPKGEKVKKLGQIRVVNVRKEPLNEISQVDCILEGFPYMTPERFVQFFCGTHAGCTPNTLVNRIEFEYV